MGEWHCPKFWDGATVFILGGGPSLAKLNLELIHDHRCIGVNNAYQLGNWVDAMWFGDSRWYEWHWKRLLKFGGLKACCVPRLDGFPGIKVFARGKVKGIDDRNGRVSWNGNSGASAINFAYHTGARRIVLLGFDMRRVDGQANWHFDHPSPEKDPYQRFLRCFPDIAKDAKRLGLMILNATPESGLTLFPMARLEDCI